ncbi:response regulator NasT [Paenibacillus phyllosphaerae]|uniref:Response regulator NasT n=1 Tax=Paenibacillus phyllosphaerae TaxID=274593 RepID=A0A7W5AXP9_9BACL|nr:ANTAR domain-containing protein [Paenibacillus phyllosphaerae]MBB3110647.1 response regulator NasT [Paenibacillus phyllosphaerae]
MLKAVLLLQDGAATDAVHTLSQCCRSLLTAQNEEDTRSLAASIEAFVVSCPIDRFSYWHPLLHAMSPAPIAWLCPAQVQASASSSWRVAPDGILFGSMTAAEMKLALSLASEMFRQRQRWDSERDQLLQRIEERKWIEQAKAVLRENKGITEAQAYDLLRKQAMNERRRIGELAMSIVKVYQLING